jgi:hypothetical protein
MLKELIALSVKVRGVGHAKVPVAMSAQNQGDGVVKASGANAL